VGVMLFSEAALNGAFSADGMAAVLQQVADSVGAEGATLTFSYGGTQLGAITSPALQQYVAPYLDPNRPADPRPARVNPSLGEAFRLDQDDFTSRELATDAYYQEFLRPLGFGWHACALLAGAPAGETVNITLRRTSRQGMFEAEQLASLTAHLPLIRATIGITQMMGGLLGAGSRPTHDDRRSLFAFDGKGRACIVHQGRGAADVLFVRGGRLVAPAPDQQAQIAATIERAGARARPTSTILTDSAGDWWLFSVVPASMIMPSWMTPFISWAALVPYERSPQGAELAHQLTGMFGLSAAEARVAALIGEAKTISAIARALGASPGTVRNHLKAIFAKVGVRRQAELVAVLGRL
jgi:DNA-binding CsgD family transcriptional regulator